MIFTFISLVLSSGASVGRLVVVVVLVLRAINSHQPLLCSVNGRLDRATFPLLTNSTDPDFGDCENCDMKVNHKISVLLDIMLLLSGFSALKTSITLVNSEMVRQKVTPKWG